MGQLTEKQLTKRELETLKVIASLDYVGSATSHAASCMGISPATAKSHRKNAQGKLSNTGGNVVVILRALEHGNLALDDLLGGRQLPFDKLTRAESVLLKDIYDFIMANGSFSYKSFAIRSYYSPSTIRYHVKSIYSALGISNMAQLATAVYAHAQCKNYPMETLLPAGTLQITDGQFTKRELETLKVIASLDYVGSATSHAASCMGISPATAKSHRKNAQGKLSNTKGNFVAILRVLEHGNLALDDLIGGRQLPFDELTQAQSNLVDIIYDFVRANGRFSLKDIAALSSRSPHTIRVRLNSIYNVLGIHNRAQLATVVYAYAQLKAIPF